MNALLIGKAIRDPGSLRDLVFPPEDIAKSYHSDFQKLIDEFKKRKYIKK